MYAAQLEAECCAPMVLTASPSGAVIRGYIPQCDECTAHLSFPMDNLKWTTGLLPKVTQLSKGRVVLPVLSGWTWGFLEVSGNKTKQKLGLFILLRKPKWVPNDQTTHKDQLTAM